MVDKKPASTTNDTSFRRTWNSEEYAAKAAAREASERTESALKYEARLSGKAYHAAPTVAATNMASARTARLDVSSQVGKTQMITGAMAGVAKKGRGAGFWCEDCDLTYKDNLQWVEHLNSKQHAVNTGGTGEVTRAGVEEVKERLRWLKEKMEEERRGIGGIVELGERLKKREEDDEREREEKREKRRERRRREREGGGEMKQEDTHEEDGLMVVDAEDEQGMRAMMGFGGFGTTAKA